MTIADMVLALDRQQGRPEARMCPRDDTHGRLQAVKSATSLICCDCGYSEPVSIITDADHRER